MESQSQTVSNDSQASCMTLGSRKRKAIYDASVEEYPDEPWYEMNYEEVISIIGQMCDSLIASMRPYAKRNSEIKMLIERAGKTKRLPDLKRFYLAVLGEQGVGKSTLINALLDRNLLDSSGSSHACTALATLITWKEGTSDSTRESDLKIEFLSKEEIQTCIKEQVQRWTELYPGDRKEQASEGNENIDDIDSENSDEDGNNSADGKNSNPHQSRKVSKEKHQAASTAKEFFEIIFKTAEDEAARSWLENVLYNTDISKGEFTDRCYRKAQESLSQISARLGVQDHVVEFLEVPDKRLQEKQNIAQELWPFVKLVTIATGHALLRHGLCIFDLPGYGDTSHLRRAVINTFRWKADFEMVVIPNSRSATSVKHEAYLDRSIHLKGHEKTMVVLNKSDQLIDESTMHRELTKITIAPFPEFKARIDHIDSLDKEDAEPEDIEEMLNDLTHDVTVAFIKHQTDGFREKMKEKLITEVFPTAAGMYLKWKSRLRPIDPILSPQETGIPALRQFLFRLPVKTNFLNYRSHAFEVLPALRTRAQCVVSKHAKDKSYAEMREYLRRSIPILEKDLKRAKASQIDALVASPWNSSKKRDVSNGIAKMIEDHWIHTKIHVAGFAKMLRENGIPVNGKYQHRNLNDDILNPIKPHLKQWHDKMQSQAEQLGSLLDKDIQTLLDSISDCINKSSADPALKVRANEALEDASRRIEIESDTLLAVLGSTLNENRLRFTTEIDINCPIATEMRPVYVKAQGVENGKGVYSRQRNSIIKSIIPDDRYPKFKASHPLVKILGEKLICRQKELWRPYCSNFIQAAMAHIQEFSDIIGNLLEDEPYVTQERKDAQEKLKKLLVEFDKNLEALQSRFRDTGPDPPMKRIRCGDSSTMSSPLFQRSPA